MSKIDLKIITPYKDKILNFVMRSEPGYDYGVNDSTLIREMFLEDVYQIEKAPIDDTGIVIDIGANIGIFSIQAVALGAKKVIAYEPEKQNFEMLIENVRLNKMQDKILLFQKCITDKIGTAKIIPAQAATSIEGVKTIGDGVKDQVPTERQEVETIRLEDIFAQNGISNCDILKVDVEGSEYQIFQEASSEVIAKCRFITMEFHKPKGDDFGKLIEKLTLTHQVRIIGKYNYGGQLYAYKY